MNSILRMAAMIACVCLPAISQAGTILEPTLTTSMRLTFPTSGDTTAALRQAMQTDASGNGHAMTNAFTDGTTWTGPSGSMILNTVGWGVTNVGTMPTDNYKASISLEQDGSWGGNLNAGNNSTVFIVDGVRVGVNNDVFSLTVNGTAVGSISTTAWAAQTLTVQKQNGVFSFFANGTQVGGEVTATAGTNWDSLHLFTRPGGDQRFTGYVSDFNVATIAVPEPASLGVVGLVAIGLIARRRGIPR